MKEKISVFIMSITCLMTIFTSCESDETDFEPNNKIELLKAKSKEFAKKYDVDVTLNDDSIAKYADQMTVEGMEEDYKAFAEMKKSLQNISTETMPSVPTKLLSKRDFLKRRKVETELDTLGRYDKNGSFDKFLELKQKINEIYKIFHHGKALDTQWKNKERFFSGEKIQMFFSELDLPYEIESTSSKGSRITKVTRKQLQ